MVTRAKALPALLHRVGAGAARLLDVVLPPQCLVTGEPVTAPGLLSPAGWRAIDFITRPFCEICGYPFSVEAGEGAICGACARERPPFATARSALLYAGAGRDLILAYKLADRTDAAPVFAKWLARAGGDALFRETDILAPVPLHWSRLVRRRYNQSALLAAALVREAARRGHALAHAPAALRRRRATPSQIGLSARERARNIAGAIAIGRRAAETLAGKRVLLIDDVYTTGATAKECARVLQRAKVASVHVLTLARAPGPSLEP